MKRRLSRSLPVRLPERLQRGRALPAPSLLQIASFSTELPKNPNAVTLMAEP